jgi:hypothetical protein
MSLTVVGAGLGRTGTHSLKIALEQLLGAPCYHMAEVFQHPEHIPDWTDAANGRPVDWQALLNGYAAAVDWPASAHWKSLAQANPDAVILLSMRDPESWWTSASNTIFPAMDRLGSEHSEWRRMIDATFASNFAADKSNKQAMIDAFNRHNDDVLKNAPADRLLVWSPQEGWAPICNKLNLPAPSEPFPMTNSTEEFQSRFVDPNEGGPKPATHA